MSKCSVGAAGTTAFAAWFSVLSCSCGGAQPSAADRPKPSSAGAAAGRAASEPAHLPQDMSSSEAASPLLPSTPAATGLQPSAADVCKATSVEADPAPVDVFMMIDQSISMLDPDISGGTRWGSIVDALTHFVQAKESAGLGVGLQYFGLGLAGVSCTPEDYATADVEIGALPDNMDAIVTSISQHIPSSVTPTPPALQGALMHAAAYRMTHPTHTVVVLLVTDGEPDFCGLIDDVDAAAKAGLSGTPSVPTYVLGVGGSLDALNQIAQAGGSDHAYIVDGATDVSTQVLQALDEIRGHVALPCELVVPMIDGTPFDATKVNVTYTASGGSEAVISYTADVAKCDSAAMAWHYDDAKAPTKVVLGANTCKTITSSAGKLGISLQCPTVELK